MKRVALITGASSGLGRGLALRLAEEGWGVGLAARREELLEEVAGEIRAGGRRAAVLPCDVSVRSEVRAAVERCGEELGPVGLLVANAGVSGNTFVDDLDAGGVERTLRVNFLGAVYAVESVLPGMLERGEGHLVAVSSLAGSRGLPLSAAYSASKGAMNNFFESLRIDLRHRGIEVTVITPGYVRTPLTEKNRHPMPFLLEVDDAVDRMMKAIRSKRKSHAFPLPLAILVRLARLFPASLYDALASSVGRRKADGEES